MPFSAIHFFVQDDVPAETVEKVLALLQERHVSPINPETFTGTLPHLPDDALLVCLLDDHRFARLWQGASERPVTLLPLPWSGNPLTRKALGLEGDFADLLARLDAGRFASRTSLLLADGEPVLTAVRIGSVPELPGSPFLQRLRRFFRSLLFLHLSPFILTTAKEQRIELAALSIEAAEESVMYRQHPEIFDGEPAQGRVTALIHAPASLLALFQRLFLKRVATGHAHGIGYVRSRRLVIESTGGPLPCLIDGLPRQAAAITLEDMATQCRVPMALDSLQKAEDKENIRITAVPTGSEAVEFFTRRTLPLLPIAPEAQFAELFTQLRRSATTDSVFLVLMFLSILLATIGLYQNSGPVIIGAMILAPLMAPIVSLSMGLVRFDHMLLRNSSRTLLIGTALALALAALFAWSMPLAHLTDQIRARLNPNLLDLGVAIVSGIAAAYAYAKEELAKSLAGVAIAVALVPPLGVAGIGIGLGNLHLFNGAFLLFLTNLVGIVFAAGTTFYLLGFASLRYARTAFFYKLLILALITIPLAISTQALIEENRIYRQFAALSPMTLNGVTVRFELLDVTVGKQGTVARVRMILPRNGYHTFDRDTAVRRLQQELHSNIVLQVEELFPLEPRMDANGRE